MNSDRIACLWLPQLAWEVAAGARLLAPGVPAAIVTEAALTWACPAARAAGVAPDMTAAQGRAACPTLQVVEVAPASLRAAQQRAAAALALLSPYVEADADAPDTLWADVTGLESLVGGPLRWAERAAAALAARGHAAAVCVGFNRVWARARAALGSQATAVATAAAEWQQAASLPVARLPWPAALRAALVELGVTTLGAFVGLPAGEVRLRLGVQAAALHRQGQPRAAPASLAPMPPASPLVGRHEFDLPDDDRGRLLFAAKAVFDPLLRALAARRQGCAEVVLTLVEAGGLRRRLVARPERPSRSARLLLDLVRLRLEAAMLAAPVAAVELELLPSAAPAQQLTLWRPRRDPSALAAALARVRAWLGESAVATVVAQDHHLPERSYLFVPAPPLPPSSALSPLLPASALVRQALVQPREAPSPRLGEGVAVLHGPVRLDCDFWAQPVHRDDYILHLGLGPVAWMSWDRRRHCWWRRGTVL